MTIFQILVFVLTLGMVLLLGCTGDGADNPQAAEDNEPTIPVTVARVTTQDVTIVMTFTG